MKPPGPRDLNRILAFLMLFGYAGLIFMLSSRAVPDSVMSIGAPDFLLHIAEYSVFGFLASRWVHLETGRRSFLVLVALPAVIASAYGTTDEIHQSFVAVRDSSFEDIWADVAGGVLGACAYFLLLQRFCREPATAKEKRT